MNQESGPGLNLKEMVKKGARVTEVFLKALLETAIDPKGAIERINNAQTGLDNVIEAVKK